MHREVLEHTEARALDAEQEAAAEKDQRRRVMEAAANGSLPLLAAPGERVASFLHFRLSNQDITCY